MFNLVKDDFDENSDDILNTINKMLEKNNFNIKKTYIAKQDESIETIEV